MRAQELNRTESGEQSPAHWSGADGVFRLVLRDDVGSGRLRPRMTLGCPTVPCVGAWGHHVAFLHPKDQGGVLIELVEEAH